MKDKWFWKCSTARFGGHLCDRREREGEKGEENEIYPKNCLECSSEWTVKCCIL